MKRIPLYCFCLFFMLYGAASALDYKIYSSPPDYNKMTLLDGDYITVAIPKHTSGALRSYPDAYLIFRGMVIKELSDETKRFKADGVVSFNIEVFVSQNSYNFLATFDYFAYTKK